MCLEKWQGAGMQKGTSLRHSWRHALRRSRPMPEQGHCEGLSPVGDPRWGGGTPEGL